MQALTGTSIAVYIGMTLILFGLIAVLTGNALARTWRPAWQCFASAIPLAAADRFLIFALFQGELLTVTGYLVDFTCLSAIVYGSFAVTRAYQMVRQYPWLYERAGLVGWREKTGE